MGAQPPSQSFAARSEFAVEDLKTNLAYRPPGQEFPKARASHRSPHDNVDRANDGVVNYDPPAFSRWTSYESATPTDWLEIEFEKETEFSRVALAIYDEGPNGGVQAPTSFMVEMSDGENWQEIADQQRSPDQPVGNQWNEMRFEKVKTNSVRVSRATWPVRRPCRGAAL
jgi:hypothetical protein